WRTLTEPVDDPIRVVGQGWEGFDLVEILLTIPQPRVPHVVQHGRARTWPGFAASSATTHSREPRFRLH
ncbi:hypothetical protein, partial [Methylobacterium cerastii]|uniref:hypothetical protein n=1 Tax=Methylobacterium cerastii TaxID=932741 RepID=UPI001EE19B67